MGAMTTVSRRGSRAGPFPVGTGVCEVLLLSLFLSMSLPTFKDPADGSGRPRP